MDSVCQTQVRTMIYTANVQRSSQTMEVYFPYQLSSNKWKILIQIIHVKYLFSYFRALTMISFKLITLLI